MEEDALKQQISWKRIPEWKRWSYLESIFDCASSGRMLPHQIWA